MHTSNVWAAWTLRSHDALAEAVPPGLSLRDVAALALIASHPGCSVEWLWPRLWLTQSGTVRLVDRLQQLGYVARAREGRSVRLTLEPSGAEALARWNDARERAAQEALAPLTPDERQHLTALLAKALGDEPRQRLTADSTCRLCDWPACTACPVDASVSG